MQVIPDFRVVTDYAAAAKRHMFADVGAFPDEGSVDFGEIADGCVWKNHRVAYVHVFADGDVFSKDSVWSNDGFFIYRDAFVEGNRIF